MKKINKSNNLLLWLLVAASIFIPLDSYGQNCRRSCHNFYRVKISSPGFKTSLNTIDFGYFETRKGCGCNVPNRCRSRARNVAQECMSIHANKGSTPNECKIAGNVLNYWVKDFDSFIKGEVCDYLNWVGKKDAKKVKVSVFGRTGGKQDCSAEKKIKDLSFDCPCKLSKNSNKPLVVQKTKSVRTVVRGGIVRYMKVIEKAAPREPNVVSKAGVPPVKDVLLYQKPGGDIMRPHNVSGDEKYKGCGIKTAQNVINYFGIDMKQKHILNYVTGRKAGDRIFTLPSELRGGLEKLLKEFKLDDIEVHRVSGKSTKDIENYLAKGFPVIALVDNGTHWVTVVGVKNSHFSRDYTAQSFIVLDNWSIKTRNWRSMSLDFDKTTGAAKDILKAFNGGTSYKPGTLIYFKISSNNSKAPQARRQTTTTGK